MAYITKKTTVNGVKPIGSNLFGTCSTAGGTAAKVVTMQHFDVLVSGVTIHVKFTHKNTASNTTLKVGGTSAVPIMRNGSPNGEWESDSVISFTYDGTYWIQNDADSNQVSHTYGLSISGNTLSIVEDGGSSSVTIANDNTLYTLSISGSTITLTGSDGSTSSVTISQGITYTLSWSGGVLTLTGSDGSVQTAVIHRALTQAQYNALTNEEKNNGTIYFITDGVPSDPRSLLDLFYPVGSFYETSKSQAEFDPNVAWGGTWVLETEGLVHIGAGSNYDLGDTGGEETHQLTESELPHITGSVQVRSYRTSNSGERASLVTGPTGVFTTEISPSTANGLQVTSASQLGTNWLHLNFGSDGAHENMQPYVVVNRWHRTA